MCANGRCELGFRTVIVKSRCKLESRLNSLIIRGEQEKHIFLGEIETLIVQSTAVSLTAALLCELTKRNIKVIFCDEKCEPSSELLPYYGEGSTSKRYKMQAAWTSVAKAAVWQSIIRRKILAQRDVLAAQGFAAQAEMLTGYVGEVQPDDVTNREGHAAKVYFNCILGEGNSRQSGGFLNACLNYGYAVVLSACNREIVAAGYCTQLGIHHINEFNEFNFGCDLMEPLRPVVDSHALSLETGDPEFKRKMADILNTELCSRGKRTTLDVAIRTYVRSAIAALNEGDSGRILFPGDEYTEEDYEL